MMIKEAGKKGGEGGGAYVAQKKGSPSYRKGEGEDW